MVDGLLYHCISIGLATVLSQFQRQTITSIFKKSSDLDFQKTVNIVKYKRLVQTDIKTFSVSILMMTNTVRE